MSANGGDFVSGGNLGYMNFPPVEGGKGDPTATVGNPAQYLSISSKATDAQKETAKKFFATGVLADAEVQDWIGTGGVPIVNGADAKLTGVEGRRLPEVRLRRRQQGQELRRSRGTRRSARPPPRRCWTTSPSCSSSRSRPQQFADSMNGVIGQ